MSEEKNASRHVFHIDFSYEKGNKAIREKLQLLIQNTGGEIKKGNQKNKNIINAEFYSKPQYLLALQYDKYVIDDTVIFVTSKEKLPFINFRQKIILCIILTIAILTRVIGVSKFNKVLFDEAHFGKFVSGYINGVRFFDIHPPLAKFIMTLYALLCGYKGDFVYDFDAKYPDKKYIYFRTFSAVFGSLPAPTISACLMVLGCSDFCSFTAGFLYATEFISITQSRIFVTDSILYFFITLSILTTFMLQRNGIKYVIINALCIACAISVKFTAASLLVFTAAFNFVILYKRQHWFINLGFRGIIYLYINASFLYAMTLIHILATPKEGYGDLYNVPNFRSLSYGTQVVLLLQDMFRYNKDLNKTHPQSSKWYEWPTMMANPVSLQFNFTGDIYMHYSIFNNHVSAFGSTVGAFLCLRSVYDFPLFIGYFFSYAPFIFITRCTWSYHYTPALLFGIIGLCKVIDRSKNSRVYYTILCLSTLFLLYMLRFWVYGLPYPRHYHKTLERYARIGMFIYRKLFKNV